MPKDIQDLLICALGSEQMARELEKRFQAVYPKISICTAGMMASMVFLDRIRFRVAVITTTAKGKDGVKMMVKKLRDRGYSPNNIFVNCSDAISCGRNEFGVDAFARGNEDGLFRAAKKAASKDLLGRWFNSQELENQEMQTPEGRFRIAERLRDNPPPPPKSWLSRFVDRFTGR